MGIQVKTTLKAYTKVSPSILDDYLTKEEASQIYVPEVQDPIAGITYGRALVDGEMVWEKFAVASDDTVMYAGANLNEELPADEGLAAFIATLNNYSEEGTSTPHTFTVDCAPEENSYFWFICTQPVQKVIYNNSLYSLEVPLQDAIEIELTQGILVRRFYAYRTSNKYAAIKEEESWLNYNFTVNTSF